jgi:hypothetical protein
MLLKRPKMGHNITATYQQQQKIQSQASTENKTRYNKIKITELNALRTMANTKTGTKCTK